MSLRAKLAVSISLLLAASMGVLGYGVLAVSDSFARKDAQARMAVIENSLKKTALDALIQKDPVLFVSSVKFFMSQYPALSYARIGWEANGKTQTVNLGRAGPRAGIEERFVDVRDPSDPSYRATLQVGIDREVLYEFVGNQRRRLAHILILMSLVTILLGVGFSYWFAGTLTAPLSSMVSLASEIGAGKLGGRLVWHSEDEIGALVKVFNKMSQRLEELDETKKNFVSSVTHELRSPLGAIESFLHLIESKLRESGNGEARQCQEYLGRIETNVRRLGGFINDLLDVAKLEKGKMECVLEPMRIPELAAEVGEFFEAKCRQQGVALSHRLEGLPLVLGDRGRLRQVLINLVSNGLKFTPSGGRIEIAGEQFREGPNRWVEVAVTDTGRGIEQADMEGLFKVFSQGRNVAQGVEGGRGTGLGLYITKSIIEQHGGRVGVRSAPGKGSRFAFTLRVAPETL